MNCAWKELLAILPAHFRPAVEAVRGESLQEIRLRLRQKPEFVLKDRRLELDKPVSAEDLTFVVNIASRYSPWIEASSAAGFITAPGGHRIGLCGDVICKDGTMTGFRTLRSVNIRVCRDFPGCSGNLHQMSGSVLVIGKPGSGKTTFLRDLIRNKSQLQNVGVVDERGELFPEQATFPIGKRTDITTGCSKEKGIEMLLRTMTPDWIAVDEITAEKDCRALLQAGWCGVKLLATAHAASKEDLMARPLYAPLVTGGLFDRLVIIQPDKSWRVERMMP